MSFEEGFQDAGTVAAQRGLDCPAGSLSRFPVGLSFSVDQTTYTSVAEPVAIDFKWGTRATAPQIGTAGVIDEVGTGQTNLTTFTHLGIEYILNQVQISAATHAAWIVPDTERGKNLEDILITFEAKAGTVDPRYKYIVFVIPILRDAAAQDPAYFAGLKNASAAGPFSLRTCFPAEARTQFAYYSICLKGVQSQYPAQNAYVFVATGGIKVPPTTMTALLGQASAFPAPTPPFTQRYTAAATQTINLVDFRQFVLTTDQLLNAAQYSRFAKIEARQDDTSAYKCVALNPDATVEGDKIDIDVATGLPLKDVLAAREAERLALEAAKGPAGASVTWSPGRLQTIMSSALGIVLAILFSFTVVYLGASWFTSRGSAAAADAAIGAVATVSTGQKIAQWTESGALTILIIVIVGFIGFILGAMVA